MSATLDSIAICIPTFRRPALLSQCLASIGRLQLPDAVRVIVLVVDNDAAQSGRDAFNESAAALPLKMHYSVQAERGLSSVRNALLEQALAHQVSHIAFIDDDEQAHPLWLIRLIAALHDYRADIACGPVIMLKQANNVPPPPPRRI